MSTSPSLLPNPRELIYFQTKKMENAVFLKDRSENILSILLYEKESFSMLFVYQSYFFLYDGTRWPKPIIYEEYTMDLLIS